MRESERQVSRSEVRMRAIADNMPALIAHIDRDERYLFVNAMGANIFGIDIDDMVGRTVREVRGEEIYAVMQPHIDAALRGETVSFEGETRDGAASATTTSPASCPTATPRARCRACTR